MPFVSCLKGIFGGKKTPSRPSTPAVALVVPAASAQTPLPAAIQANALPALPRPAHHSWGDGASTINPASSSLLPVTVSTAAHDLLVASAKSANMKDSVVDNIAVALDLVKDISELVDKVPFIGPVAGVLSKFVNTYKEIKDTKDKREILLQHITDIASDLCKTILRMEATNHADLITRLKPDVETYAGLIENVSVGIKDYDEAGTASHISRRNQLGSYLSTLQRELDSFGARFRTNRLVDLAIEQNQIKNTLDKVHNTFVEEKIENWLGPPPNMKQKQHETQSLRKDGTGNWLLDGEKFINWQDNAGTLWIRGDSGAGKSVLSSAVIDRLVHDQRLSNDLGKSSAVAFFYFDFKDKEGHVVERALRRIVLQLSAGSPFHYRALEGQYKLSNGQTLPTYQDLRRILGELLRELGRTYFILDALDECPDTEQAQLVDFILTLHGWSASPLHLLFTSQSRAIFTDRFKDITCIPLDAKVTKKDMRVFVRSELANTIWASRIDTITEQVIAKSSGMFRLAACLLVELSRCRRQTELDEKLNNLPNDLFGIYSRFLQPPRIRSEDFIYVAGIFRWLLFSDRVDTTTDLADAISFDLCEARHTYVPSLRSDHANTVLEWLEGLVSVQTGQDGKQHLQVAHASVKDYLLSPRFTEEFKCDLSSDSSHTFIAQSCLGYLLHFADNILDSNTFSDYPLAVYVAKHLDDHLLHCSDQTVLLPSVLRLLENGSKQYIAWIHLCKGTYNYPRWGCAVPPPLYMCSKRGYRDIANLLLANGADINEKGGKYRTALQAASRQSKTDIVRLLLEHGAEVNAQSGEYGTALQAASWHGTTDIVRLLLEHGAEVNAQVGEYRNALQAASRGRGTDTARLLLEHGAEVNAQGGEYGNALQAASRCGNTYIVRLLLEHGAEVNAQGGEYGNALQAASWRGDIDIIRLLLEHGADVNAPGGFFGSALEAASWCYGHIDIARLLLEHGAEVNAQGGKYGNVLQAASWRGNTDTVRLLLEHGADVNAPGGDFGGALEAASSEGNTEVVRILLANGAEVNAPGPISGTPLQAASTDGYTDIVQLLLEHGADISAHGGVFGTASQAASRTHKTELVQILLENGADVNAQGGIYGNALQAASWRGNTETVRLLLEHGADVNAHSGAYGTALCAACTKGKTEIVQLLLKHGADVNAPGGFYGSKLQVLQEVAPEVARFLSESDEDHEPFGWAGSPLQAAASEDHTEIVELLRRYGAVDEETGAAEKGTVLEASHEIN
ncbi:ankyrin repeat-containing domain protein [Mycena rebaudengoi]|nr:ankyrin repeat-containing domain protein [Mycena rebaudengoi]